MSDPMEFLLWTKGPMFDWAIAIFALVGFVVTMHGQEPEPDPEETEQVEEIILPELPQLFITGNGTFSTYNNITNYSNLTISGINKTSRCEVFCFSGGCFS